MNEKFLHFIWKNNLFSKSNLKTVDGENIEIIDVGFYNNDEGPDFFNAKIKIGDTLWAGNIELDINSSDWFKHNHNSNKLYDNVILQVVTHYDKKVCNSNGLIINTFIIEIAQSYYQKYSKLINCEMPVKCSNEIQALDSFVLNSWIDCILIEKLEKKTHLISDIFSNNKNSWEETFYILIARNFGFNINGLPFELLAKSLPLNVLAKHKNSLIQLEALLFGQAGFLDENISDNYFIQLKNEYLFLKHKYKLQPLQSYIWKFLRLRPSNFPTIRLAQFAHLINKSSNLFSKIIDAVSIFDLFDLFSISTSEYWLTHYTFGKVSHHKQKTLGNEAINTLIINTCIPFIFVYGKAKNNISLQEKALAFLSELKPEKNSIIDLWNKAGIKPRNAAESQALIYLKTNYCDHSWCLDCRIAHKIIQLH